MIVEATEVRCARKAHDRAEDEFSAVPTVVLVRRGVFRYHAAGRTAIADANVVVLLHPGRPYRITHPTDRGDRCVAFRFDPDTLVDALGHASSSSGVWTLDAPKQRRVHAHAASVPTAWDALAREEGAIGVLEVLADTRRIVPSDRDAARIEAVRERIAADLGAHASLATLAREVGLSPFHLARRFRAHTGTSLHQYRLALRLGESLAMLREGHDDITALAHELGFASSAHFSTSFHRAYGRAPSAARNVAGSGSGGSR